MKKKTTKKPARKKAAVPAAMRPHPQPTINAEAVDDVFEKVVGNLYALHVMCERTNTEVVGQLLEETIASVIALQMVWEKISLKEELS